MTEFLLYSMSTAFAQEAFSLGAYVWGSFALGGFGLWGLYLRAYAGRGGGLPNILGFSLGGVCCWCRTWLQVACIHSQCGAVCNVCVVDAGRGFKSHAYTHSVQEGHHVFLNLETMKFYCLPDNYHIVDQSLEDIVVSRWPTLSAVMTAIMYWFVQARDACAALLFTHC